LRVEYGHCTVQQMYVNVFNNNVKVTNGLWVSLAIPYTAIRIMENIASCDGGTLKIILGWINAWMYGNCCYKCFVCRPYIGICTHFLSNGNGTPNITYESTAQRLYISNFLHVLRNKLRTKVGDRLYCKQDDRDILTRLCKLDVICQNTAKEPYSRNLPQYNMLLAESVRHNILLSLQSLHSMWLFMIKCTSKAKCTEWKVKST
jgi:hypothetical protein